VKEPSLFSTHLFYVALRALGSFRLKRTLKPRVTRPYFIGFVSAKRLPVARRGDVYYAEINA